VVDAFVALSREDQVKVVEKLMFAGDAPALAVSRPAPTQQPVQEQQPLATVAETPKSNSTPTPTPTRTPAPTLTPEPSPVPTPEVTAVAPSSSAAVAAVEDRGDAPPPQGAVAVVAERRRQLLAPLIGRDDEEAVIEAAAMDARDGWTPPAAASGSIAPTTTSSSSSWWSTPPAVAEKDARKDEEKGKGKAEVTAFAEKGADGLLLSEKDVASGRVTAAETGRGQEEGADVPQLVATDDVVSSTEAGGGGPNLAGRTATALTGAAATAALRFSEAAPDAFAALWRAVRNSSADSFGGLSQAQLVPTAFAVLTIAY